MIVSLLGNMCVLIWSITMESLIKYNSWLISIMAFFAITANSFVNAETTSCTVIKSIPIKINTQGIYCLTDHVTTGISSGNAIDIKTNNVTLDLNGWKVGGQSAGLETQTTGIFSSGTNIVIKNGIVRGFYKGIVLTGRGARVEGILADQNTNTAIQVESQGALVSSNQIVDTGGSTVIDTGDRSPNQDAIAIAVKGFGSVVKNNIISGLSGTGIHTQRGIHLSRKANHSIVRGNILNDKKLLNPNSEGDSIAIQIEDVSSVGIIDNTINNFTFALIFSAGAGGVYRQNTVINGGTSPYSGGTKGPLNFPE